MKRLIKRIPDFRYAVAILLIIAVLTALLYQRYYTPGFSPEYLERYQTRMARMVDMIRTGVLETEACPPLSAGNKTYNRQARLPVLYMNLSYRGIMYISEENGSTGYLFVCRQSADKKISEAYIYHEIPETATPLSDNLLTNWAMMKE